LARNGEVLPGELVDLSTGGLALAVKVGARKPDISIVAGFTRALLDSRSLVYSDSASGVYLETVLFRRLGVAQVMKAKRRMIPATTSSVGLAVARGDYELGFQGLSELKAVPGIEIAGLIPNVLQPPTPFSAGLAANARNAAGGRDLIRFLSSPAAFKAIRGEGMHPVGDKRRLR
jgi:molybdate transport system substrate-binding protein